MGGTSVFVPLYKVPRSVELRTEPLPLSGALEPLKRELSRRFWEGEPSPEPSARTNQDLRPWTRVGSQEFAGTRTEL